MPAEPSKLGHDRDLIIHHLIVDLNPGMGMQVAMHESDANP